jgi:hypothetical protein
VIGYICIYPYTFALKSDFFRKDWGKIGCYILYQAVFNFHKKTNLNEEDIELLLLIKSLDTDVSYHIIKTCIESALIKFFQSITNNADSISIKIANWDVVPEGEVSMV